jgi:pilus assembly protein Flp/PilA
MNIWALEFHGSFRSHFLNSISLLANHPLEHHMKSLILTFFKNESGATAIEYGLIAAGIALAIIAAVQGVGTQLSNNFGSISTSLK